MIYNRISIEIFVTENLQCTWSGILGTEILIRVRIKKRDELLAKKEEKKRKEKS